MSESDSDLAMNRKRFRFIAFVTLALVLFGLDQGTKAFVVSHFYYGQFLPVTDFFNLCYVRNTGAAFSFLSDFGGLQIVIFSVLALIIIVFILVSLWRNNANTLQCVALSLVLSGALGNLWDRVTEHSVVDFLDFYLGQYHWPAFNVADIAICVGAFLICWAEFRKK